ncbi:GumC family protein [Mucilaginibacter sp. E4BP6]|uniref:GumC family protein n=1 Tax=Mucilaginibacter sp. E4BP6 TaxID=2723089 RepID=UPI0015C9EECF|nr:polysaccharide biosynthesis tyrosine autokinase [Mucilaginibacter sp. E4BP6]NYE68259.1 capsular exopolysaccharide synthesis family protein [Mucilaginibacter sp. E4BP6]
MNQNRELFGEGKGTELNIREIVYKYLKNWKWFVLCIFISMALGYVYIQSQIPQYKVQIDILIKDNRGSAGDKDLLDQLNLNSSGKIIDNEIEILKSNTLMERVVSDLSLENSYYIQNRISKKVLYKNIGLKIEVLKESVYTFRQPWTFKYIDSTKAEFNGKIVPLNHPVETEAGLILITPDGVPTFNHIIYVNFGRVPNVAEGYIARLKIEAASKQSTVLIITLEDADVQRGKDVLNRLVDEYNQAAIEDKNLTSANQLNFLTERIKSIAIELNSVEKNVQDFKSANGITDLAATTSVPFQAAVQSNNEDVNRIKIQQVTLNNLENYLKAPDNAPVKLPAMLGVLDPTLLDLVKELGDAQIKKESLLRTIPETNPVISSINDEIKALKKSIFQTLQNLKAGIALTQQQLKAQGDEFQSVIKGVPSKERGLADIMREASVKNNLFTYLLQKREETALSLASTVADSRIIDKAKGSNFPFKPVKTSLYLTFLLLGLFIPFAVIAVKETLNIKVRNHGDIEKYTDATILADIVQTDDFDPLIVVSKPRSMIAEQVRALRSNLQYISPELDHKVLLFTSSISGEGKSFVSLNLGASLATTDKKVIILELDLRKPKLNVALGMDNSTGISNYLIGQVDYRDIIKPIPQQANYSIITSGPNPPNPAELLLNGRIEHLINELKKEYDYVLLDAPPVGLVTDAQILANFSDATLFMVRYNYTIKSQIRIIDELVQRQMFKNLNIIFNAVDAKAMSYGYGYGYGYGYYSEDSRSVKNPLLNIFGSKKR